MLNDKDWAGSISKGALTIAHSSNNFKQDNILTTDMPKPCQICIGDEESDDVFVYNCCFNSEEVGCWGDVCDECAFRSNRQKWRGDRVCPPCWQAHVNAKNQTTVQAESTEESQPVQCPECEGIGEIFVERDKFDSGGSAPGLPRDEFREGYQTCFRCDGTGVDKY